MTWTYVQSNGDMKQDGVVVFTGGYAGYGDEGKNKPHMQCVANVGPLPQGKYTLERLILKHQHMGSYVIELKPDPSNDMCGRSGFYIHGDSISRPGLASNGCIILARAQREEMWKSGDKDLEVIEK